MAKKDKWEMLKDELAKALQDLNEEKADASRYFTIRIEGRIFQIEKVLLLMKRIKLRSIK